MSAAVTLFQLAVDGATLFDGSIIGLPINPNPKVKISAGAIGLNGGMIDVGRHPALDLLESFTVDVMVTPEGVSTERQNIVESQTPSFALFIDNVGKLVGSVHIATGWTSVDSGTVLMQPGVAQRVTFSRDDNGQLALSINNQQVGSAPSAGPIQNVGAMGVRVGLGMDGTAFPFKGGIADLAIRRGVVLQQQFDAFAAEASRLETLVKNAGFIKNIAVHLVPDESHARLQHIKDIMNAAGVQTLSDLDTLPVHQRTPLSRGQVLVAPRRSKIGVVNWGDIVNKFRLSDALTRRETLATRLTNRNSATFLKKLALPPVVPPGGPLGRPPILRPPILRPPIAHPLHSGILNRAPDPEDAPPVGLGRPQVAKVLNRRLGNLITVTNDKLTHVDPILLDSITSTHPALWPLVNPETFEVMALQTVPIDSAVVIAGTLDLTNQQFVVEPNVETLYIIAETVICGPGAAVTWRRPGGSTPGAADNPDLNGRDFLGVQTKADSRDGIPGGNGGAAVSGTNGADGRTGPNIEMWVKSMTGMPDLDFAGENGIVGGAGQRGGRGGRGGGGSGGKRVWFFGWHCTSDPGDGGDGGDGGAGGGGGRGGNGGNGGNIKIGVLTGTLANTVVNQTFKLKNHGGRRADGGAGGAGGDGGAGGRSGNGDTCHGAHDGHAGDQGQPGGHGPAGFSDGNDASVTFFEFTQAAWDDLMTRPWISQITPVEAFPGDAMTIHGSRFTTADHAIIGGLTVSLNINADESASVTLPASLPGGIQSVFVRRADGIESNRVNIGIKPQLDVLPTALAQGSTVSLTGHAFIAGATVLYEGGTIAATDITTTSLKFVVPGTGGGGSAGGTVTVQVRNPDGRVSNSRAATQPRILEVPFRYGQHNLSFPNFAIGLPDWGTYEDTFGTVEVLHEQLDPVFGHPFLTAAYFLFYTYFLKGKDNGGLATGFCTSLASLVADRFWQGLTDTPTIQMADVQKMLTGVHGKLLSRESLLTFHDQGRQGVARVDQTFRQIESTFLRGTDRQNQPLLFFIPSGEVWDSGYIEKLSDSHCVMPYRIVYPPGAPAPQLTPDGNSTLTDMDGVELYVWDCNHPESPNCRLKFRRTNGEMHFDYLPDSSTPKFTSEDGITLGMMRHGDYMLADHDLPFTGPFGLTAFIIDFILSPADMEVTDVNGLRTGNFGGQLHAEIPGSHPAYLMKGLYLLPAATALTRNIVGNAAGTYNYHSITPDGTSILFEGVPTQAGHRDVVSISADASQVRFAPAIGKEFTLTVARVVNGQSRAIAVTGLGGGPGEEVDLTLSPELNLVTIGNRGVARNVTVKALSVTKGGTPVERSLAAIALPEANDLAVSVADWSALDLQAQAVPF